jgi:hypothetical protein
MEAFILDASRAAALLQELVVRPPRATCERLACNLEGAA